MDFFDKLGKKASETYKITAEKTGRLAKEAKFKMLINESKSKISDVYEEIGKKVYQKHIREEEINISEDLKEECEKIDVLSMEIESARMEILNLKDKKQCRECYKEIDIEDNFCPNCGTKQEHLDEDIAKEPEIIEDNLQTDMQDDE